LPTILVPFSEEEKKKLGQRQIGTSKFKSVQLLASSCSQYFGGGFYTCTHGAISLWVSSVETYKQTVTVFTSTVPWIHALVQFLRSLHKQTPGAKFVKGIAGYLHPAVNCDAATLYSFSSTGLPRTLLLTFSIKESTAVSKEPVGIASYIRGVRICNFHTRGPRELTLSRAKVNSKMQRGSFMQIT
jgi:hypothetical protein